MADVDRNFQLAEQLDWRWHWHWHWHWHWREADR